VKRLLDVTRVTVTGRDEHARAVQMTWTGRGVAKTMPISGKNEEPREMLYVTLEIPVDEVAPPPHEDPEDD
jgi:hypothetical protein